MLKCLNVKMESGSSLYLALMMMTIMLAIALGLSSIFIGQVKMIKQIGNSVIALCAADSGIENILLLRNNPPLGTGPVVNLSNGATYQVDVVACEIWENCNYRIKSIGDYLETKRAVEIIY
ncbi:MAG: hypothetical protein ABIG29_00855 [Candidatus Nealsonbacteria bacterium]